MKDRRVDGSSRELYRGFVEIFSSLSLSLSTEPINKGKDECYGNCFELCSTVLVMGVVITFMVRNRTTSRQLRNM